MRRHVAVAALAEVLSRQIAAGADELERGDFVEVDAQDLEDYLDRLTVGTTADSR